MRLPSGTEFHRRVRISRRLNAPPERVFRAWTDPEELARWLPEQIDGCLAVGSRASLVWPDQRVWWEVVEVRPPRTFVFRRPWLPDERLVTRVDVNVEPVGYGSRVQLEDGPFPLDQPGVIDAWTVALEHWSDAVAMLRAHLDFNVDLRWRG